MKTGIKRCLSMIFACIMLFSIIACQHLRPEVEIEPEQEDQIQEQIQDPPTTIPEEDQPVFLTESSISVGELASNLIQDFTETRTVEFQEPMWNVLRDQDFTMYFEFCIFCDADVENVSEIFSVYTDPNLENMVFSRSSVVTYKSDTSLPEGHSRITLHAGREFPVGRVWGRYFSYETLDEAWVEHSGELFVHQSKHYTWGYVSHLYLGVLLDPVTAEPLERPLATIVNFEDETLAAPVSEFFVTEDGLGGFRWKEVEGADFYLIVRVETEITHRTEIWPVAKTRDTTWIHPEQEFVNGIFSFAYTNSREGNREIDNFAVIAVNSETHSALGNTHSGALLASRLVSVTAFNLEEDREVSERFGVVPTISLLPMQRALRMADDSVVHRRPIYDAECCKLIYEVYDTDIGDILLYVLRICYTIEGTPFKFPIMIEDIDPDTYQEELEEFFQRMEDAAPRGGTLKAPGFVGRDKELPSIADRPTDITINAEDRIYANSALSAFLAINMLAGNEHIDLSDFPESANLELLWDTFSEAIYQNPLILHVAGARTFPGSNMLIVEYRMPLDTIIYQQNAIRQIVPRIIAKIITEDMTDLEKSIAINQFLVDTAEYDWDALDSAEQFNFQRVDPRYYDSFTAYGILINGVGVCAGYADAFKLLADEAGLESIVVTGYLEGFLPHAWNRVNINGQWHTVDVTNNANDYLYNIFLHLPDYAAGVVLVEDDRFVLSEFVHRYRSISLDDEYFYSTGRFFDVDSIASELAERVAETGSATLRTDFNLDDDTFLDIIQEVVQLLDMDMIYGFHWFGAIFLTDGS